jgi:hypothetical protein
MVGAEARGQARWRVTFWEFAHAHTSATVGAICVVSFFGWLAVDSIATALAHRSAK